MQLVRGNADEWFYRHIDTVDSVVPECCVPNSKGRITWSEREAGDSAAQERYRLFVLSESDELCLEDEEFVPEAVCWLSDDDVLYWASLSVEQHYDSSSRSMRELRMWHVDDGTFEPVLAGKDRIPIRTRHEFCRMVVHPGGNYIAAFCWGNLLYYDTCMRVGCFEIICLDSGECYAVIPWCEGLDDMLRDDLWAGDYIPTTTSAGGYGYSRNGSVFYNPSYCNPNDFSMAWIVK